LRRPDRLHGLSPWTGGEVPVGSGSRAIRDASTNLEQRIRAIIAAMDPRGAWVEEGTIGKANRLVSVFAANDMIVTLGGKTYPMKENDTLDIFQGDQAPREQIIVSRTFARNIELLSKYAGRTQ
jgi:hypothetical protein